MTEEKLLELGIKLPQVAKPLAAYTPALKVGNLVMTSGQVPVVDGAIKYKGKLGKELSEDEGKKAAEICALNCLAAVKSVIEDLDKISRVVKLVVFVASAEGFVNQPEVANGASELIGKIFGEAGKHTRSAVGVAELPKGAAVEIEMIVELKG
ncbi:MAG: RidA family protein [Ignavibacteriaceae bacterium]|jgi:enamine deaminase RidA (YjgF/YER057c/UK114 family)|nr:RidA family protein [Ignavibacteriaceae bacterium]HPO55443.1 RidA family protein [Ignavibacteriaceae bacterium]